MLGLCTQFKTQRGYASDLRSHSVDSRVAILDPGLSLVH